MKFIREFSSFSKDRRINEEFIGGILKKLGRKISLSISKKFGMAKEADKVFEDYKNEVLKALQSKFESLKAYIQYERDISNGDDVDENKKKDLLNKMSQGKDLYEKNIQIIKKKMDLRINDIIKKEKNDNIKTYIEIKRLEMQQEVISKELELINKEAGSELLKDNEELNKNLGVEELQSDFDNSLERSKESLKNLAGGKNSFDFDKAKKDKNYNWVESKYYKEYRFVPEEKILYWSNTAFEKDKEEYKGSIAFIGPEEKQKDLERSQIYVTLKVGKEGFVISKGKIIKSGEDKK